jgi:hypothetical protein
MPDDQKPPPKKLYVPPAVLESGRFERLVLACGHLPTGPGNCHPAMVRS